MIIILSLLGLKTTTDSTIQKPKVFKMKKQKHHSKRETRQIRHREIESDGEAWLGKGRDGLSPKRVWII
ncbi:hypothetical protein NC651_031794 [Populus alba x Populus x berolinensis]|nr:hypothetical protein NC651_031794 [Populus alba x Populus x berolinensis]